MSDIKIVNFEPTSQGEQTHIYVIENNTGASVSLCDFGASVVSVKVPDKNGNLCDIVLGYDHIKGYESDGTYFGATVGRCCGRIAHGKFELNERKYQLPVNNGNNHLHGGFKSFSRRLWTAVIVEEKKNSVMFSLESQDGDEGYPGNMKVSVRYTFDDENVLSINWSALCDKDTICNLTNHSYFNLNGHKSSDALSTHRLRINSGYFVPINANLIPTGEISSVKSTPFDFTKERLIKNSLDKSNEQIKFANGIDHMFVLNNTTGELVMAAEAEGIESGITLKCFTTQNGVHLYTANYVDVPDNMGKEGTAYKKNSAFCLKTQGFPDAVNHNTFPTTILKANENYTQVTKYCFGIVNHSK